LSTAIYSYSSTFIGGVQLWNI